MCELTESRASSHFLPCDLALCVKLAREEALSTLPSAMSATLQDYNSKTTALYAFEVLVLRFWIQSPSSGLEEMAMVKVI